MRFCDALKAWVIKQKKLLIGDENCFIKEQLNKRKKSLFGA